MKNTNHVIWRQEKMIKIKDLFDYIYENKEGDLSSRLQKAKAEGLDFNQKAGFPLNANLLHYAFLTKTPSFAIQILKECDIDLHMSSNEYTTLSLAFNLYESTSKPEKEKICLDSIRLLLEKEAQNRSKDGYGGPFLLTLRPENGKCCLEEIIGFLVPRNRNFLAKIHETIKELAKDYPNDILYEQTDCQLAAILKVMKASPTKKTNEVLELFDRTGEIFKKERESKKKTSYREDRKCISSSFTSWFCLPRALSEGPPTNDRDIKDSLIENSTQMTK